MVPVHPHPNPVPEFLRAQGSFNSSTTGVYLKIGNQCAQGLQRPPSPRPRPCCCRWKQLTASPVTKEQSALIKAHLRTAQGWLENPSMLLTPDEEGLSPWALPLQHLPQRRAVPGKWSRTLSLRPVCWHPLPLQGASEGPTALKAKCGSHH